MYVRPVLKTITYVTGVHTPGEVLYIPGPPDLAAIALQYTHTRLFR